MPLLIDGHNLIGQMKDISLEDIDDEARLVRKLIAYHARTGKNITVVFDNDDFYHPPGGFSGSGVKAIFAPPGSSADKVLIRHICESRNPRGLRVVTSDREVARAAHERGAAVTPAPAFVAELDNLGKSQAHAEKPNAEALSAEEIDEWLDIFTTS